MFWLCNGFQSKQPPVVFYWGDKFPVGVVRSNTGFFYLLVGFSIHA